MDQVSAIGLLYFTLLGFTTLVELTIATQQIDCNEAIAFLGQHWEQTSLEGAHPN